MIKPKQEPLDLSPKHNTIRIPKPGDVVNPDGDIYVHDGRQGTVIKTGRLYISYEKGLMATRHGWHVIGSDGHGIVIEKRW